MSFNPYSTGSAKAIESAFLNVFNYNVVSILILLEVPRQCLTYVDTWGCLLCFNPYSTGSAKAIGYNNSILIGQTCFNPYSTGSAKAI